MSLEARLQAVWLRRGFAARALWPLALIYRTLYFLNELRYRRGWKLPEALPLPVVVVGNLVAGGAGKTPTTIALVHALRTHGFHPGVVSRGYGRDDDDSIVIVDSDTPANRCGDEPLLIALRSRAPVVVGADRVLAAQMLMMAHAEVDVIVCDDGLQNHALARNVQVIVFDERGAGNGWQLPAGPLRQAMPEYLPQACVVLYNAPAPSTPLPGHLAQRQLQGIVSLQAWWAGESASHGAIDALPGPRVMAAAGLAMPQRFFNMLRGTGLKIEELPLPDHHAFATLPWPPDTPDVIVTEKDAVKLRPEAMGSTRVWVAPLDFQLSAEFVEEVLQWLPPPRNAARHSPRNAALRNPSHS